MALQREKMTAESAVRFERYSAINSLIVRKSLECGCKPYEDVFTFRRWIAQGFVVQKGQKSIKLALVRTDSKEDEETGEIKTVRRLGSSAVFCRHQVTELKARP